MKSIEWIELLIEKRKLPSHRQAALLIGMAEPLMSKHRNGKAVTLDDKYAYKLEELLGLPHGKIVADQHAERSADPQIANMWRKLAASAASFLIAVTISYAPPSEANTVNHWVAGSSPAGGAIFSYVLSHMYLVIRYKEGVAEMQPLFIDRNSNRSLSSELPACTL